MFDVAARANCTALAFMFGVVTIRLPGGATSYFGVPATAKRLRGCDYYFARRRRRLLCAAATTLRGCDYFARLRPLRAAATTGADAQRKPTKRTSTLRSTRGLTRREPRHFVQSLRLPVVGSGPREPFLRFGCPRREPRHFVKHVALREENLDTSCNNCVIPVVGSGPREPFLRFGCPRREPRHFVQHVALREENLDTSCNNCGPPVVGSGPREP
jgi:hypothetical protein